MKIEASGKNTRQLNDELHAALEKGSTSLSLKNVNGQRYLCAGVKGMVRVKIEGVPGNDLGAFMDGPLIDVIGNGQDGIANTMNRGRIIVHGDAGDVLGYGMRGGSLFIRGNAGYRVGIHMKEYRDLVPVMIVGGSTRDYLGEYMAGGIIIVLALDDSTESPAGSYVGSGAHGGVIYVRGKLREEQLGKDVRRIPVRDVDRKILRTHIREFCRIFKLDPGPLLRARFSKYAPLSNRPYGKLYAY